MGFGAGGGGLEFEEDRNDLILVDETRGEEAAGVGVGFEIAGEGEAGGDGEFFEDLGLGAGESGGEVFETFSAGCFGEGLTLFVGDALGKRRGKKFLIGRGHGREGRVARG